MLSMLGRRCKLASFTNEVSLYFWSILSDSEAYSQEVVDCCITKFSDMIKYSSINTKKPLFQKFVQFMTESKAPTLPVLKLFTKIVDDHKERERISNKSVGAS